MNCIITKRNDWYWQPASEPEYDWVDVLAQLVEEEPVAEGERPADPSHLLVIIIISMLIRIIML